MDNQTPLSDQPGLIPIPKQQFASQAHYSLLLTPSLPPSLPFSTGILLLPSILSQMSKRSDKDKHCYKTIPPFFSYPPSLSPSLLPPSPSPPCFSLPLRPPFPIFLSFSLPPPHLSLQTEISRRLFGEGKEELVEGQLHQTDKLEARKQVNKDLLHRVWTRGDSTKLKILRSFLVMSNPEVGGSKAVSLLLIVHQRQINVKHELAQLHTTPPRPFMV